MAQEPAGDPKRAPNTLVESAARACEADMAAILRLVGTNFHRVASYGYSSALRDFIERHPFAFAESARMAATRVA